MSDFKCDKCDDHTIPHEHGGNPVDVTKLIDDFRLPPKPQWFKTSKTLPDGDYGWRLKKGSEIHICVVVDGLIYGTDDFPGVFQCDTCKKKKLIHTTLEPTIFNRGEWCLIVWPD